MSTTQQNIIWHLGTRIHHFLLLIAISVCIATGLSDNIDAMQWHFIAGYSVIALLAFRLCNGLWGSDYGHFKHFPISPQSIKAYLQGQHHSIGHNPIGSWSVIIILLSVGVQGFSGLFNSDDIFTEGPWAHIDSESLLDALSWIHDNNYIVLLSLISIHIVAVIYHQHIKQHDLLKPMITGHGKRQGIINGQEMSVGRYLIMLFIAGIITWLASNPF